MQQMWATKKRTQMHCMTKLFKTAFYVSVVGQNEIHVQKTFLCLLTIIICHGS